MHINIADNALYIFYLCLTQRFYRCQSKLFCEDPVKFINQLREILIHIFLCTFQGVAMRAFLFKLKNINSCDNALLPRTIDASVVELDLLSATVVWP